MEIAIAISFPAPKERTRLSPGLGKFDNLRLSNICLIVATIIANLSCFVNVRAIIFRFTGVGMRDNCRKAIDNLCHNCKRRI